MCLLAFSVLNKLADFYKILYEFVMGGYSILVLFDFLVKSNTIPGVTHTKWGQHHLMKDCEMLSGNIFLKNVKVILCRLCNKMAALQNPHLAF